MFCRQEPSAIYRRALHDIRRTLGEVKQCFGYHNVDEVTIYGFKQCGKKFFFIILATKNG